MRFESHKYAIAALAFAGYSFAAAATEGTANVHACVWHSTVPVQGYNVHWYAGGSSVRCMGLTGSDSSMYVDNQGLKCANIGLVSYSFTCVILGEVCIWELSYVAEGAPYSGTTLSMWGVGYLMTTHISLKDKSPGTNVCSAPALCDMDTVEWADSTDAQLYIIFQPGHVSEEVESTNSTNSVG